MTPIATCSTPNNDRPGMLAGLSQNITCLVVALDDGVREIVDGLREVTEEAHR